MTRFHGIEANTYDNIIIDSGAVYYDFTDIDNRGTLLGATKGGAVFSRKPKYVDLPYEGAPGKVVGGKHLIGFDVTLEVNVITLTNANIPFAIPNSVTSSSGGYVNITEEPWNAEDVHIMSNIVLIGERANSGDPIIISLRNPICESDFNLSLKDKSEVVSKWKFSAYYTKAEYEADGQPWEIGVPSDIIIIDKFAAVAGNSNIMAHSSDGINWTDSNLPALRNWRHAAYSSSLGVYVAIAYSSDKGAYTDDGVNWTENTMPASRDWDEAAFGAGVFVAIANGSDKMAYSSDGINWTEGSMPASRAWRAVIFAGGLFVALADGSDKMAYSSDGINWTEGSMPASRQWVAVAHNGTMFVAIAYLSNGYAFSTDGINWTSSLTLPSATRWNSLSFGAGVFVAIAYNSNATAYSSDGINWTSNSMTMSRLWEDLTFGDGLFVAIATSTNVMNYSSDGINWTQGVMSASRTWRGVTYG